MCPSGIPCSDPLNFGVGDMVGGTAYTTWGTPNATITMTGTWADTTAQITPTSPPFPAYTGMGSVQLYLSIVGNTAASFAQTPNIVYTFPGGMTTKTGCWTTSYVNTGAAYAWVQLAPASGSAAVTSGAVSISPVTPPGGSVDIGPTPGYLAIVCQ